MENLKLVLLILFLGLGTIFAFIGWVSSWVKLIQRRSWLKSNYKKLYLIGVLFIVIGLLIVLFWQ